jgi:hypothetical protein
MNEGKKKLSASDVLRVLIGRVDRMEKDAAAVKQILEKLVEKSTQG